MELCISSTSLLNSNPSLSLDSIFCKASTSLPTSSLQFQRTAFGPRELSSPPARIRLLGRPLSSSPPNGRRFSVSASSVAVAAEKDRLPADIEVTEVEEPNSRVRLSVEVPPVVCEDCYRRVIKEFTKQAKIPGFRPGKNVPESILLSYVGKQNVQKATFESILKRTLPHAMSSDIDLLRERGDCPILLPISDFLHQPRENLRLVTKYLQLRKVRPRMVSGKALKDSVRIVTKFSEMENTYISLSSLRYDVIVDVAPEVKWIPEDGYKSLKIVVEIDSERDAQRACQQELRRRHKSLGTLRIITDRGLQIGDVAVLDISATTIVQDESNVKNIPSAESKGFHFDTEDGDKLLPGFLDSIIGIQRGETKSFPLFFPDNWNQENLRGVHAQFTVECKELFYRDLPELDESLADKLLPGCTSLKQVEDSVLQRCLEVEQTAKDQATDNAILDQLSKMVEIDVPRSLFEEQGRQLYGAQLLQIQANMKLNEQQLASLSSPKAVNEYLDNQKENITHVIKQNLAVGDIFRRENLQFSTEELVKEVENSIAEFKRHKQEYDEERVREQVREILEGAKVLEWLRERAEINYIKR